MTSASSVGNDSTLLSWVACRIRSSSESMWAGLGMKYHAPIRVSSCTMFWLQKADSTMHLISLGILCSRLMPSSPGRIMSITTTSGFVFWINSHASSPSPVSPTT